MNTVPQSSSVNPSPLRISHLFLLTTSVAVAITLARIDGFLASYNYRHRVNPFWEKGALAISSRDLIVELGQGVSFALLLLAGVAWRRTGAFATQPGHLIGALVGSALVLDRCFSLINRFAVFLAPGRFYHDEEFARLIAGYFCIISLLIAAMLHPASKGLWRWAMASSIFGCIQFIALLLLPFAPLWLIRILPTRIYPYLFSAYTLGMASAAILLTAAALGDLQAHAPKRDWRHWAAVIAAQLYVWPNVYKLGLASVSILRM